MQKPLLPMNEAAEALMKMGVEGERKSMGDIMAPHPERTLNITFLVDPKAPGTIPQHEACTAYVQEWRIRQALHDSGIKFNDVKAVVPYKFAIEGLEGKGADAKRKIRLTLGLDSLERLADGKTMAEVNPEGAKAAPTMVGGVPVSNESGGSRKL